MESLYESFGGSFHVTLDENDTSLIHPRFAQYKQKYSKNSQEERRKNWLASQKEKRTGLLNECRDLSGFEELNTKGKHGSRYAKNTSENYKDVLMLSEWLVDVPEDLYANWIVKLCPEGRRVLVVAQKGRSYAFGRNGHPIFTFNSLLPGGLPGTSSFTLLDCIFSSYTKTFYILDVIFWGCLLRHCEAEFRFFWLHNKLEESPELKTSSKNNRYKFVEVLSSDDLKCKMATHPCYKGNKPKLDGVLFYHKEGLYSSGERSPLVSWLKPFMLSSILNISINPEYLKEIPCRYQKMEVTESSDVCDGPCDETQNCEEMA